MCKKGIITMKTEEDEAFDEVEKSQGWRKRQIADKVDIDPYTTKIRNETIEEIAKSLEEFFIPFGQDTINSFAIYIREMKR